jgi:hypothetical protein
MLIKFFWIYIGSFFACSVALIFMVKNYADSFASKSKKPVLWGGLASTGFSGGAYLATYISDHLFTIYWVLALIYLLFGFIHVVFFHKRYFSSNKTNRNRVIIGEILFALSLILFTVVVFSSLQYFLRDRDFMFFPMLISMLSFFIPIVLLYTFEAAYKIPPPVFATWYYPLTAPIELPDEKVNEKILVIAFEISKNATDNVKTNFRAKGPEAMLLGDLYYHFLNDYNDVQSETPIKFTDKDDHPYEWWFRIKPKWYQGNRILDPELSIRDNHVKENSIIICERIIQDQEN